MNLLLFPIIGFLIAGALPAISSPNNERNNLNAITSKSAMVLKVGYIDYANFIEPVYDNDNQIISYTGYGVDYLSEITDKTGIGFEYVTNDWDKLVGTGLKASGATDSYEDSLLTKGGENE
ncbi:MAG: hypothetical protein WCR67_02265 [Bacilli bacterium]